MADVVFLFKYSPRVPYEFSDAQVAQIAAACDGKVWRFETEKELLDSGVQAEILYTWGATGDMPVAYCRNNPKLKWYHSFSSGMDAVMNSEIAKLPIIISGSSGIHGYTIAETVLGYILAFNRTLPFMLKKQREHVWGKGLTRQPTEAIGKTIGTIGAGAIGREVAKRARAFGMKTIGLCRNPQSLPSNDYDEVLKNTQLDLLLARSDYVVVAVPLGETTRRLLGREQFARMKKNALLINVARGGVLDQAALIDALREGTIAGAALDVTDPEPLPPDSPLWDMDNVMITPHISADAPIVSQFAVNFFCDSLKKYLAGQPVPNQMK
jgi:phosphoglycerate dehydrogenase-like enzyme